MNKLFHIIIYINFKNNKINYLKYSYLKMCLIDKLNNRYLILIEILAIFAVNICHIVYGFLIKVNYFSVNDLLGSSPLFDFSIKSDCSGKSAVAFHKWGGRLDYEWTVDENLMPTKKVVVVDQTDLKKINGVYFCYNHISYKDLLNNGQIIKKGTECPSEYKKNCGRLDSLEQELCIKETENCPLYDVGIGSASDLDNYNYDSSANIYYNNENFNKANKKIIGRLVLNEGQPCYNATEKLWKKFSSKEGFDTNLQCDMEIFGKYSDDRYEERGEISYKRLYQDNLNPESQNIVVPNLVGNELVHLYKREFFGIDKECDKKYNLNDNTYESLHKSEQSEFYLLIIEGILICCFGLPLLMFAIMEIIIMRKDDEGLIAGWLNCIFYAIFMAMVFCCLICQAVFYSRVASNDLTGYDCSDPITNEIIRKGFADSSKNIRYIRINFYLELALFVGNCVVFLIGCIWKGIEMCLEDETGSQNPQAESSQTLKDKSYEKNDINQNQETKVSEIPLNTYYPNPS